MEDADAAAVHQFKDRPAAGEEELLPAAMADHMLAGESPVRVAEPGRFGVGVVDAGHRGSA